MSGTITPTGGAGAPSAGFAISDGTRNQLLSDVQAFGGLVGSGDSSAAMGGLQTLTNDTQAAVTSYYGQNAAGLNATSLRDLNGVLAQMAQVGMKLSTGGGAAEASQFANTMAQALAPETAPMASAGGTGPASAPPVPAAPPAPAGPLVLAALRAAHSRSCRSWSSSCKRWAARRRAARRQVAKRRPR